MRNADLHPTRLVAQQQSVSALTQYKLDDNAESSIGLLTMAGNKVDVKISPSRENHKLLNSLKTLKPSGNIDILSALRISQLTLRNRTHSHQRPRIVMFIGSPINLTDDQITQAGKELKKNNIALDIVLFGYESMENGNFEQATALINAVQNSGNSRLVTHYDPTLFDVSTLPAAIQAQIPLNIAGATLSDVVIRSPIGRNIQPAAPRPAPAAVVAPVGQTNLGPAAGPGAGAEMIDEDIDEDMAAAIALSLLDAQPEPPAAEPQAPVVQDTTMGDGEEEEEIDEDLLAAIQLSLEAEGQNNEEDDFAAALEAVSGGTVTKDEGEKKEEKKD